MALPRDNLVAKLEKSNGSAAALALLKSLANIDRLTILCSLIEGEKSVGELELKLSIRQPSLSQQLGRLRADGLVNTRRDSKVIYYSIASSDAEEVIEVLYKLYCK
jgi:DNA-binding transcriptional ArsR family regulator